MWVLRIVSLPPPALWTGPRRYGWMFWDSRPSAATLDITECHLRAAGFVVLSLRLFYTDRCWLFIDDPSIVVEGDGDSEEEEEEEEEEEQEDEQCEDMDGYVDDDDI